MAKCGETIRIKVCRTKKGTFTKGGGTRKATKKRGKSKKGAACKPGTLRRYGKMKCGCKTTGGGFKPVPAYRCKKSRKRK